MARSFLKRYIEKYQIKGDGLKTFVETHWTSMYETANSVVRLQITLEKISSI